VKSEALVKAEMKGEIKSEKPVKTERIEQAIREPSRKRKKRSKSRKKRSRSRKKKKRKSSSSRSHSNDHKKEDSKKDKKKTDSKGLNSEEKKAKKAKQPAAFSGFLDEESGQPLTFGLPTSSSARIEKLRNTPAHICHSLRRHQLCQVHLTKDG